MKTIQELVYEVHTAATNQGMDLAPSDVGYIISLFFEGLVHTDTATFHAVDDVLQDIADECSKVTDEG